MYTGEPMYTTFALQVWGSGQWLIVKVTAI